MATETSDKKVFVVESSPHLSDPVSSRRVMIDVLIGLAPATLMSVFLFRGAAMLNLTTCVVFSLVTEAIVNACRRKPRSVDDFSAIVTGLILGLSLPPTLPWWMAALGAIVSVGIGKMVFGGLGSNIFNPAMVGRAFLMATFGLAMTTWTAPVPVTDPSDGTTIIAAPEAMTEATPLALAKQAIKQHQPSDRDEEQPDGEYAPADQPGGQGDPASGNSDTPAEQTRWLNQHVGSMFLGNISGSLGETSALLWLLGGLYLLLRRTITWHIPLAVLAGAFVVAAIAWLIDSSVYPLPWVHLSGGALMMGAFFIATDPVSSPLTARGRVIFGAGVGVLVMLIRLVGGYPEGVMYAVLLMNGMTPLLDRWTRPRPLGGHVKRD